jgi:hypothetical protein
MHLNTRNPKATVKHIPRGQEIVNHDSPEAPLGSLSKLHLARACPRTRDVLGKSSSHPRSPLHRGVVSASPKPISGEEDNPELGFNQRPQGT